METDQLQGLSAFVRAVESGSFTAAARAGGTTPSAVSKSISRLEQRLGVRLFQRSTRVSQLTEEGRRYYDKVAPLLLALADAKGDLDPAVAARGPLRVSLPADLGRMLVDPITARFVPNHPFIRLDLSLTDRRTDLLREGFDLALRVGAVDDTSLVARPMGTLPLLLVASPAYLGARGAPRSVEDLVAHDHIRYRLGERPYPITFADHRRLAPDGVLDADNGEALRVAAVNGLGIAQLILPSVRDDLIAGRLVQVLPDSPLPAIPVQFLHAFGATVPTRARLFIDFVAESFAGWGQ